ncbi:MAG: SUF system FeS assembly protein, NifU family [candidate division TM6 bacterium GW2011_GWF2_32_72]|nr:MAG: SUF system FeS assembly protein, NifU family [candidate division TM6 bacterium GW2011_GWF2_32_72]
MYKQELLDHYKNPQNYGSLKSPDFIVENVNPSCGDEVKIEAKIINDVLHDIKFSGRGCVISQAAASMLTEQVKGKNTQEILDLDIDFVRNLIDLDLGPTRMRCAMLALEALKKGLTDYLGSSSK